MSIAITLLGHAPKKKDGYSSGGGEGGTSQSKFLHLAWANSEEGEGFTKDNLDTDGHIKFFPYLGMCLSEDRDDEVLSFNSYQWTLLKSSKNSGNSGNGGGDSSTGGGGNSGNCCETCCNYQYCPPDDGGSDENPPRIFWYRPTYQVQECHENSKLYGETETGIEFFGNQATVMYADDDWNQLYSANPNGTHFIFNLPDLETCPQSFRITVVKYMDFNRGPMYFADFTDNNGNAGLELPLLTLLDGVQDDSEDARKVIVDGTNKYDPDDWMVMTNFDLVSTRIHRSSPIDTENPPVLHNDANNATCVASISDSVLGNSTYKNALASFNDLSTVMFGEQKTEQIFAARGQMKETFPKGMRPARDCVEDIHDYDIRYRWFATSREELISHLPTHFTMKYHDISIEYPVELQEYDATGETTVAGGPLTTRAQYVADTNGYYGAVYDVTNCAYEDFKSDNFWIRFLHEYTIEQLCSGATKPLPSQGGTPDNPGGNEQGGDVPSIDEIDPDDEDYSQYLSCSVGACDKGEITVSWPEHNVSSTWFQHGFYKDAKLWVYGTYFNQGAKFVDQLLGIVGLTVNLTKDPLTGGTDGVYLARIDDGWYVTGPFPYNGINYYAGIIKDDSNTDGHESFKPGVWQENAENAENTENA